MLNNSYITLTSDSYFDRQTDREAQTETDRERDKQRDKQAEGRADRLSDRHSLVYLSKLPRRKEERQTESVYSLRVVTVFACLFVCLFAL